MLKCKAIRIIMRVSLLLLLLLVGVATHFAHGATFAPQLEYMFKTSNCASGVFPAKVTPNGIANNMNMQLGGATSCVSPVLDGGAAVPGVRISSTCSSPNLISTTTNPLNYYASYINHSVEIWFSVHTPISNPNNEFEATLMEMSPHTTFLSPGKNITVSYNPADSQLIVPYGRGLFFVDTQDIVGMYQRVLWDKSGLCEAYQADSRLTFQDPEIVDPFRALLESTKTTTGKLFKLMITFGHPMINIYLASKVGGVFKSESVTTFSIFTFTESANPFTMNIGLNARIRIGCSIKSGAPVLPFVYHRLAFYDKWLDSETVDANFNAVITP